jgi:hypothetical protein
MVSSQQSLHTTTGSRPYDFLPGATVNPPAPGIGVPTKFYLLSNNHVLANSNNAMIGDPILQPGRSTAAPTRPTASPG